MTAAKRNRRNVVRNAACEEFVQLDPSELYLSFYAKGLNGGIADWKAGWKGCSVWSTSGDRTPWLKKAARVRRPSSSIAWRCQIRSRIEQGDGGRARLLQLAPSAGDTRALSRRSSSQIPALSRSLLKLAKGQLLFRSYAAAAI